MALAAVHEFGSGTQRATSYAAVCPVLAEADMRAQHVKSCFDPSRTSEAKFVVLHDGTIDREPWREGST